MTNKSKTGSKLNIFLTGLLIIFFLAGFACRVQAAKTVRFGVLAKRGFQAAVKRWKPLTEYLSRKTGYDVKLVPLNFKEIEDYVADNKIDLLLANQKFYVKMKKKYGMQAIATVINSRGGPYMGGVIFTQKGSPVRTIRQLVGKRIGVVSYGSAGGFLIQAYDLLQRGINIVNDAEIRPLEGQDYVVYAVINGAVDAGFVRTGQLESMARERKVKLSQLYVISKQNHPNFPLLCSTVQLWPAWPVAASRRLSKGVTNKIKSALQSLPSNSRAAMAGKIKGFAPPGDYSVVADALDVVAVP